MAVKNLIFTLSSLIILVFGSILFEYFQEKINDTTWLIVISKIVLAFILISIFVSILKYFAGLYSIEWKGD